MQRNDGGWGEDGKSYYKGYENLKKKHTISNSLGVNGSFSGW